MVLTTQGNVYTTEFLFIYGTWLSSSSSLARTAVGYQDTKNNITESLQVIP